MESTTPISKASIIILIVMEAVIKITLIVESKELIFFIDSKPDISMSVITKSIL